MPKTRQRDRCGRFVETWMFDEGVSNRGPHEVLVLPKLPPPWKPRWYRKRGKIYVDADRGRLNGRPVRLCKLPERIVAAVAALESEIQQHGQLAKVLTTAQRWMAAEAFLICERLGVVLMDVVREFEKTHPHGENARTLEQLRAEVVVAKTKSGRSEKHVASLDYQLRKLTDAIGDKPLTTITKAALQAEIESHAAWNANTVHSVVQRWKIALNFAVDRGYLIRNPAEGLELPRKIRAEPCIFSLDEVRRLMAATLFADGHPLLPACRAYLAIGFFAGLRPYEIAALRWQHVDLETATIRVVAITAKDRDRRIVDLPPNLVAWLRPLARRRGHVLTHSLDALRAAARTVLSLKEWPADVMRHTYVSNHFAEFQNEAATKKQIGHRDDGRVFYDHYMVPIPRHIARQFWSIVPPVGLLTS